MGDGPPGFRRGFTCPAVLRIRPGGTIVSTTWLLHTMADLSRSLRLLLSFFTPNGTSYNPSTQAYWFGLFPFRSPLLGKSILSFSSSGYLDVSVPLVCLHIPYIFRDRYYPIKGSGLPHSEIPGSMLTYSSPRHIGVRPVLLRLLAPRHPPCALCSLTTWMWAHQR